VNIPWLLRLLYDIDYPPVPQPSLSEQITLDIDKQVMEEAFGPPPPTFWAHLLADFLDDSNPR
jgi:hypothetical protein